MRASSYFCFKNWLDGTRALRTLVASAGSYATAPPPSLSKENAMSTPTPHHRRWLRKFWGAVCVIVGLVSIAAGLESVILE